MKLTAILTDLKWPAALSVTLVLPLMILEWVNRRTFNEGFPIVLFGLMWLLSAAFLFILIPLMRDLRAGDRITASPVGFLLKVVILILIAWIWISIVRDQMPCFAGVPNCD